MEEDESERSAEKGRKTREREDLPASSTLFKQISRALICEIHRDPMDQRAAFHYLSLELTRSFDRNQDQVKKKSLILTFCGRTFIQRLTCDVFDLAETFQQGKKQSQQCQ